MTTFVILNVELVDGVGFNHIQSILELRWEKKIIPFRHQIGFVNKDVFAIAGAISEVGAYETAAIDAADSVEALKKGIAHS